MLVAAAFVDYLVVFYSCFGLLHKPENQVSDFAFVLQQQLGLELARGALRNGYSPQPHRVPWGLEAQNSAPGNLARENPVQSDLTRISACKMRQV